MKIEKSSRILDNGLFILNLSDSCGLVMTHLSPTRVIHSFKSLITLEQPSPIKRGERQIDLFIKSIRYVYISAFLSFVSLGRFCVPDVYKLSFGRLRKFIRNFVNVIITWPHRKTFILLDTRDNQNTMPNIICQNLAPVWRNIRQILSRNLMNWQ